MFKKVFLMGILMFGITILGFGQAGTVGSINGTVTTAEGEPLPGVAVMLKSPALVVQQMVSVSDENGRYRFVNLSPGTYELTYEMENMGTLVRQGIVVSIGKTSTIDVRMEPKTLEEKLVITGQAPVIDKESTTGATNMDTLFLKSIPSARTLTDLFNMAPGVTGSTANGSSDMSNSYNLDGVNMVDSATGVQGASFGIDIMEEMSVQSGGLAAEYGNVQGAMVNVVTKSGGNKFSGSASFYLDHESFQSKNTEGTGLGDKKVGAKIKYEPSIQLGGPIIKNKLWFFLNLNMINDERYAAGYPYGGATEIAPKYKTYFPYVKFTFSPNQNNKLVVAYDFYDSRTNDRGAAYNVTEENTYKQKYPTNILNVHYTHIFSNTFFGNLKLGIVRTDFNLDAKVDQPMYQDLVENYYYGGQWRNYDHYGRYRSPQINLDATTFQDFAGNHEIKFGAEYTRFMSTWKVGGVHDDVTNACYNWMWGSDYLQGMVLIGEVDRKDLMENIHFFLQDTWSPLKNLTLNIGFRYEISALKWPKQGVGEETYVCPAGGGVTANRSITSTITAYTWKNLVPRLGLVFDLFSDGKTLLKGSYGRYTLPNQMGFVNIAHPNGWFGVYEFYMPDGTVYGWSPWVLPGSATGPQVGHPDYPLKSSYQDEFTVGIERELFEDWSASLRYIKKMDRNMVQPVDAAQLDIDKLMRDGVYDWTNWETKTAVDPYNGQTVTFYSQIDPTAYQIYIINPPDAKNDYDGIELQLRKRFSHKYQIQASYVYANSRGLISTNRGDGDSLGSGIFEDPNVWINHVGRLPLERRHQIKVQGLLQGPLGINVSGYLHALSGTRYTRVVRSQDLLGPYALNQGTTSIFAEERGSQGYPFQTLLDLRLEKSFRFSNTMIAIFADCFNVFNSNFTTNLYNISSDPSKNYPYKKILGIVNPRIFRLGCRFEFN